MTKVRLWSGWTIIGLGVVVMLVVVYELFIVGMVNDQQQASATETLDRAWSVSTPVSTSVPVLPPSPNTTTGADPAAIIIPAQGVDAAPALAPDQGFAKIHIPSIGVDYTIIEGTTQNDLAIGPGHYSGSQLPGQPGNFAVAGHRGYVGAPFNDLGQLNSCDAIVVETQDTWYVYHVLPMQGEAPACSGVPGIYGREITEPTDYAQVYPVPHVNSVDVPVSAQPLITLTTCHPEFSNHQRMIIHGLLTQSYAKAPGFLPSELNI